MNARDIMTAGAVTVRPDAFVSDAARIMLERGISGLPVVDREGALVGIVTERDFLRRAEIGTERRRPRWLEFWLAAGTLADEYVHSHSRRVDDVMTRDPVSVAPDCPADEIVALMERHRVKRLPVVEAGKLVGIVSRSDLLRAFAHQAGTAPALDDDLAIRRKIVQELERRDWAPTATINVGVHDGVVELHGTVTDERVRDGVRVVAETTPGVKQVVDQINVIMVTPGWL